jgi:hypothetical protein
MTLFCKLSRKHYWCTPHRSEDQRLVQVCYECGAERPARELHNEKLPEGVHRTLASATMNLTSVVARPVRLERPQGRISDQRVALGQPVLTRLTLVK